MKKNDVRVIANLRKNGRMALTDLSRKTGLPVSTIHEKVKKYIEKGLLKPNVLINFPKLGFETRAYILVGVEPTQKDKLIEYLVKHQNVNTLMRINSGWTAAMECVFKTMNELENFMEDLESRFTIRQKQAFYVLDELKREAFFSDESIAEALAGVKLKYNKGAKAG